MEYLVVLIAIALSVLIRGTVLYFLWNTVLIGLINLPLMQLGFGMSCLIAFLIGVLLG